MISKSIHFYSFVGTEEYTESKGRIQLTADERNIKNAVLFIDQAEIDDRKFYNCTGTNLAIRHGNANYTEAEEYIYVRVKGNIIAMIRLMNTHQYNLEMETFPFAYFRKAGSAMAFLGYLCWGVCVMCHYLNLWEET